MLLRSNKMSLGGQKGMPGPGMWGSILFQAADNGGQVGFYDGVFGTVLRGGPVFQGGTQDRTGGMYIYSYDDGKGMVSYVYIPFANFDRVLSISNYRINFMIDTGTGSMDTFASYGPSDYSSVYDDISYTYVTLNSIDFGMASGYPVLFWVST